MRSLTWNRALYVLVGVVGTSIGCGASAAVLYLTHYPLDWVIFGVPGVLVALLVLLIWRKGGKLPIIFVACCTFGNFLATSYATSQI
jgi:hypothetical protein